MRTITIEVNGDATVMLNGTLLGSTPPALPVDDVEESLRHDTPQEVVIAAACHEANRQYCRSLGDTSHKSWSQSPGAQRAGMISGVRGIQAGTIKTPQDSHARWMAEKLDQGWVYGPEKSEVNKTHPCLVAFAELPLEQRRKDVIFFTLATALLSVG